MRELPIEDRRGMLAVIFSAMSRIQTPEKHGEHAIYPATPEGDARLAVDLNAVAWALGSTFDAESDIDGEDIITLTDRWGKDGTQRLLSHVKGAL